MPWRKIHKLRRFLSGRPRGKQEIDPDEVMLDARNLPHFDVHQFQGRIEKPIAKWGITTLGIICGLVGLGIIVRLFDLQIKNGSYYAQKSAQNSLHSTMLFSSRGTIYDRNGVPLAWNITNPDDPNFALRQYIAEAGFGHILGFVKYPNKDSTGFYYTDNYDPKDGIELVYNNLLSGKNGEKLYETNSIGQTVSENVVVSPVPGQDLSLSIDSDLVSHMYQFIQALANDKGFTGGAGALMDIRTGEILALTSYPDYDPNILSDGKDSKAIAAIAENPNNPFLDRFVNGLYAPGSIVKPYIALGALNENIISPDKKILSTGSISIPNPYDPKQQTTFKDWRAQGWVNMEEAISVSSDVYFYEVGGGYQDQPGLGITKLEKYLRMFGLGSSVNATFFNGPAGTIPDPVWKAANFGGAPWTLGDTYHTTIGQYGFQVTPAQMLIAAAALANDGTILTPTLLKTSTSTSSLNATSTEMTLSIPKADFDIVKAGMRLGVTSGTATALNIPEIAIAAKTGTAQVGPQNRFENSWVEGFYPADNPHYAFIFVMEHGPISNLIGSPFIAREFLQWMADNHPEYLR
jgi:penicillin-binding protein 2